MEIISRTKRSYKKKDILEFYDEFINGKYKNYLIIMDNDVIYKSKVIKNP